MKEQIISGWETLESEQLKHLAEFSLHTLAKYDLGNQLIDLAVGQRIVSYKLNTELAGMHLENPLLVGAGWDKKGWAVDGLYALGFAGTEVGTVLPEAQDGGPKPRLWYKDGASLNDLRFNSPGMEVVASNLDTQQRPGILGISVGKNKLTPDSQVASAHAAVAERLYDYGDYFVINLASPNTPGLRDLLNPKPLTEIVQAVIEAINKQGNKPLFVKTTVDLALNDLDNVIEVCLNNNVAGLIDTNSSIDERLKAIYGWQNKPGGASGNIRAFQVKATERMKHITRVTAGTGLQRIGVGGINDAVSAIERLEAGAQAVQVVTGIRQRKTKVARNINLGILVHLDKLGTDKVSNLVGLAA